MKARFRNRQLLYRKTYRDLSTIQKSFKDFLLKLHAPHLPLYAEYMSEVTTTTGVTVQNPHNFSLELEATVETLRTSLEELVHQLPTQPRKPIELAEALQLDKSLAWKLVRLVEAPNAVASTRYLPGTQGLKKIFDALESSGCSSQQIDKGRRSLRELDNLVRKHAGTRATFLAMLRSLNAGTRDDNALRLRKDAFRSAAAAWGVQTAAQISIRILKPSEVDTTKLDAISINGLIDLNRLHPDVPWVVARAGITRGPETRSSTHIRLPLEQGNHEHRHDQIHLIPTYCSHPLPALRLRTLQNDFTELELVEGAVGQTASSTIITGDLVRSAVGRWRSKHLDFGYCATHIMTPTEWVFQDVVLHKSVVPGTDLSAAVYAELGGYPWTPADNRTPVDRLTVKTISTSSRTADPDAPAKLQSLLNHALRLAGWQPSEFRIHRVAYQAPLLGSVIVTTIPLPDRNEI